MKLFAKILVLLLILAMAGPFFMRGPDGQPLMRISDVTQKIKSWMNASSQSSGSSVEVHRWQDKDGQWHYSDQSSSENSEVITVDPNVNVIQSTPIPKPVPVEQEAPAAAAPKKKEDQLPNIFHPLDETNQVKEELEQRNKDLRKRLDDT